MNWRYKIELNATINRVQDEYELDRVEDDCPTEVKEQLAAELEKAPPLAIYARWLRKCVTIAGVNRVLDAAFDAADANAVWCGLP